MSVVQNHSHHAVPATAASSFTTICNLCSIGCSLKLIYEDDKITTITGAQGLINEDASICNYPLLGYKQINDNNRITEPLMRKNGVLEPVSWEEAFEVLHERIITGESATKAFFAGARLTNEEQYLVQKLSRAGAYSNNIGSFHYLGRGSGYTKLSRANIPFAELVEAKKIVIVGAEVCQDNPVAGQYIFNNRNNLQIPVQVISTNEESTLLIKADTSLVIKSYFHFIKAVNYYIVSHKLEDGEYIKSLVDNFSDYSKLLLSEDYDQLLSKAGVSNEIVSQFSQEFQEEHHTVLVFAENQLSGHACSELYNLAILTGKHGRAGAGLLMLKEKNNTHGLHDLGIMWNLGTGATSWEDPMERSTVQFQWRSKELPYGKGCSLHDLRVKGYESMFIFGEDPVGCAIDRSVVEEMLNKSNFLMVQDYTLTPTASIADMVMPASFAYETGGTYTNCQRVIQSVDKRMKSPLKYDSWKQLDELLARCGYDHFESGIDVTFEIASLLPKYCTSSKLLLRIHADDNFNPLFRYGCDSIQRMVEESLLSD